MEEVLELELKLYNRRCGVVEREKDKCLLCVDVVVGLCEGGFEVGRLLR